MPQARTCSAVGVTVNTLHVRHVRDALERDYRGLIDLSDIANRRPEDQTQAFLSRGLAALAARNVSGCDPTKAAASIIDGADDGGLDSVVLDVPTARLWLVQAKWSDKGAAGLGEDAAGKMRDAFDHILNSRFDRFNSRFQKLAADVDTVISNPNVRVTLVIALMGQTKLAPFVESILDRVRRDANGAQEMVDVVVLGLTDFHRIIRTGVAQPRIDLDISLESPGYSMEPYLAYQGAVGAGEVASWYDQHRNALFDLNIRKALGHTTVNKGLLETLTQEPDHFLYFNNGITVLCESIQRTARKGMNVGAPIDLHLEGANVVNGAQTVASICEAMRTNPDQASQARVWLRLISLENAPTGFAKAITLRTNTQNQVEARDFVALDETQPRLRDEFALSLHKTYVVKRGEIEPDPTNGCTVAEAAIALACAHHLPELSARAKNNPDVLYDLGSKGGYRTIFHGQVNAYRVWRAVLALRSVRLALAESRDELTGRGAQVAAHGDLPVAHVVFRQLNLRDLDNPDLRWEDDTLPRIGAMASVALSWLIDAVDKRFPGAYVQTVFKSDERTRPLVDDVLVKVATGTAAPDPVGAYRKQNAVDTIIDGRLLAEGTLLEFRPGNGGQRKLLTQWLADDERRRRATWVSDRNSPLVWGADGKQYSPNALVKHMLSRVTENPPRTVRGIDRWFVSARGSLAEIAAESRSDI